MVILKEKKKTLTPHLLNLMFAEGSQFDVKVLVQFHCFLLDQSPSSDPAPLPDHRVPGRLDHDEGLPQKL